MENGGARNNVKKRVAIVGLGEIAQKVYLPLLSVHDKAEIVGMMNRTEAKARQMGEKYKISGVYGSLSDLLKLQPDAVFVHSSTESHAEIVMRCLEQGCHVYVDKPLSYSFADSAAMAEKAAQCGKLLAVGFNRRFAPAYMQAKEWMRQASGRIDQIIAQKHRVRQQRHIAAVTLYDDLIHMIDLLMWLGTGESAVRSFVMDADPEGRMNHASGMVNLGGTSACFLMDRFAGADLEKLELHGGGRSAGVTNMEQLTLWGAEEGELTVGFGSWDTILYRRGFTGIVDHFLDTMDQPEACTVRADRVLGTHRLIEQLLACRENAIREGRSL